MDIKIDIKEIEDKGYHLFVDVEVNGKHQKMLLDTGASKSVFDESGLELTKNEVELSDEMSTGLGTNTMPTKKVKIKNFTIGDLTFKDETFAILNLSHVNETYKKLNIQEIIGVLGSDILFENKAIINYETATLSLSTEQ
jgi:predicted aspartyl protease